MSDDIAESYGIEVFKQTFKRNQVYLQDYMEIKGSTILASLRQRDVITPQNVEDIEGEGANYKRVAYLVNVMMRRPHCFRKFIEALIESEQSHIAETLVNYLPTAKAELLSRDQQTHSLLGKFKDI